MKQYLVVQLARFGDLLQTKRLILSLAQGGSLVHLCVDSSLSGLASLIYPDCEVHGIHAHGGCDTGTVLLHNAQAFSRLQSIWFDGVYNLNFSSLNFALSRLFSPELVHGYKVENGQDSKDLWMRMAFRWTKNRRTSPLNIMDFWGLLAENPVTPQEVNPIAMRKGGGIGVVLAGRNSRRSLPPDILARCVESVFAAHNGADVVLLGTKAESQMGSQLMRKFERPVLGRVRNLAGKTSFQELIEIICGLDVVLTPDTGTMHLAAHLGTPVHAFFLSSAWAHETGPYGLGHRVWQALLPCSPCLESQPCPINVQCLNAFSQEQFYRFLQGKIDDDYPADMQGMVSMLDAVGVTYMPVFGEDPKTPERKDQRGLVAEHIGVMPLAPVENNALATALIPESEWMLKHS